MKKTYVIMISKHFLATHPRAGQETYFKELILSNYPGNPGIVSIYPGDHFKQPEPPKIHTLRENYDLWKRRVDQINDGKAVLSLRQWTKSPYNYQRDGSKQEEFLRLEKAGIQKVLLHNNGVIFHDEKGYRSKLYAEIPQLPINDGLNFKDFYEWFCPPLKNPKKGRILDFKGGIIHFTDFRY